MNSLYSISQNGYPKEIILKSDTVVAITYPQLKEINSELEASKGKDELILSLEANIVYLENIVETGKSLILNYKEQVEEYKIQANLNYAIINGLEKENQILKKKINKTKTWGIIGGFIGGSIITGITIGLLTK